MLLERAAGTECELNEIEQAELDEIEAQIRHDDNVSLADAIDDLEETADPDAPGGPGPASSARLSRIASGVPRAFELTPALDDAVRDSTVVGNTRTRQDAVERHAARSMKFIMA